MTDRDFEAELASLELDDSGPHGGPDTSVASSQLTDFLVQHGVLSPSRASSREQLAALSSSVSSSASSSPSSSPYRDSAAATTTSRGVKDTNTSTPERRNLANRLHAAGFPDRDSHTASSFHSRGEEKEDSCLNHSPRSGVSSLGLASPPRHPYQPIMQGTGGEALPLPRRPLDTPAAAPPASASSTPSSSTSWEALSRVLRQEGYRTVSGSEEPREVLGVVRQVLRDRRELSELLKSYQMERQRRDSEQRVVEGRLEGVERERGSLSETLQAAEDTVKELLGEVERAKREGVEGVREQKGKNAQLVAKLRQSEHRVKQREAHIDKMNSKLEAMVAREAKEKESQKAVIRCLQLREPRPSGGGKQLMEVVGALESARQRALEEVKGLREEVGMLNSLVMEKENYIQRMEGTGGTWLASPEGKKQKTTATRTRAAAAAAAATPAAAAAVTGGLGGAGMQQLLEQVYKLERALRHGTKKEKTLKKRLEEVEEERKGLKEAGEILEKENGKLKMELEDRPTPKAWKASQKQVEELEARLKAVQDARSSTTTAASSHAMRLRSSSSSKIDITKQQHEEKLKPLVDDICTLLSLQNHPSSLPLLIPSLRKLTEAMPLIPPLESFVTEVCFFLARTSLPHGQHLSPEQALKQMPMSEALHVLKAWGKEREGERAEGRFRSRVRTLLSTRAQGGATGWKQGGREEEEEDDDDVLLGKIAGLVQFESEVMAGREGEEAVEGYLRARPDILVNRVVVHFRQLFGVRSLEGVFPKMNELYLFASEMGVFTRVLKSMLRLPLMCPNSTLLAALQTAVRRARGRKGRRTAGRKGAKASMHVLEGVPEEGEEGWDEEDERKEPVVVEESVLVDGGNGQGFEDEKEEEDDEDEEEDDEDEEDEEKEDEEEEKEEESPSTSDTTSVLSEPRHAKASYLPQHDDSSMLSGTASGGEEEEEEVEVGEENTSILSTATSASSASAVSSFSSTSPSLSSAALFTRTRPGKRPSGEIEKEDVSGVSTSISSNAADQSSISNVDFRLLGVLSAAESRSRDSPLPAPGGARALAPPPSCSSSSVASSSITSSSSTSWTKPLPCGALNSNTTRTSASAGSRSSAILRGFSSSTASTGSGLLGVLSFAEKGDVAAFPTPAKTEGLRHGSSSSSSRSFSSSM